MTFLGGTGNTTSLFVGPAGLAWRLLSAQAHCTWSGLYINAAHFSSEESVQFLSVKPPKPAEFVGWNGASLGPCIQRLGRQAQVGCCVVQPQIPLLDAFMPWHGGLPLVIQVFNGSRRNGPSNCIICPAFACCKLFP